MATRSQPRKRFKTSDVGYTLITALRDANVQEEANILEEHFVGNKPIVTVTLPQDEGSLYTFCIIILIYYFSMHWL